MANTKTIEKTETEGLGLDGLELPTLNASNNDSQTSDQVKALGETSSTESDEPSSFVRVFNQKIGDYERVEKPKSEAKTITADMIRESWERKGSDRLNTDNYAGDMRRCFVSKDRSNPATVHSASLGYVPCRDKKAALASGHQFGKVEGWEGEVVHLGDSVLLHCPDIMAITREERVAYERDVRRQTEKERAKLSITEVMSGYSGSEGMSVELNYEAIHAQPGDGAKYAEEEDRNVIMAQNFMQASMTKNGMEPIRGQSMRQGFRAVGPKGNDSFLPESPGLRKLLERLG